MDFLDENEPLDGTGLISDDDCSAILLPSDGGLEISGKEGDGEAKSSDGKSLNTRVTMAMIRCVYLEVHVEEEIFAEFGVDDSIEDVGDESIEQEGSLGEGFVEAEVEHQVEEEALVAETLLTGTQPMLAGMMLNHSPRTLWIFENLNHENLFHWESLVPISHDIVNLKGNSIFFKLFLLEQVAEAFTGSTMEFSSEDLTLSHIWSTFHSPHLISFMASNAMTRIQTIFAFLSGILTPLFLCLQYILNKFKFRSFVTSLSLSIAQKLTPENVLGVSILLPILSKRNET